MTNKVHVESLPLLGRAEPASPESPTYQLYGRIASSALPHLTLLPQRTAVQGAGKVKGCREASCRIRRIRSGGCEVQRLADRGEGPIAISAIRPPEAGAYRAPSYSLLVDASTPEGFTQFRMDIGETLDLLCSQVNLTICGPDSTLITAGQQDIELEGIVTDANIGVAVSAIETADGGHRRVTFSELVRIPADAALMIVVPSCAREVKAYMVTGTSGAAWTGYTSSTVPLVPELLMQFDAGGLYSLDETRELGGIAGLQTDTNASDRLVALVWQIEP